VPRRFNPPANQATATLAAVVLTLATPATGGTLPGATCSAAGGEGCPAPIPDAEIGGVVSSFEVSGCDTVDDLDLGLAVDHGWTGDLRVTLEGPGGTRAVVVDRPGATGLGWGCRFDDVFAVLDDQAAAAVEDACADDAGGTVPAIGGTFTPTNPLSAFDGRSGNGRWSLRVADYGQGDTGTLLDWSLDLDCTSAGVDLELTKSAVSGGAAPGGTVVYTLEVHNAGTGDATEVLVTDFLPAGTGYLADGCGGTPADDGAGGGLFLWRLGTLPAGVTESCELTLAVDADAAGVLENTARVTARETDLDPTDDDDGSTVELGIFFDGFESGDLSAWSGTVGGGGAP